MDIQVGMQEEELAKWNIKKGKEKDALEEITNRWYMFTVKTAVGL